MPRTPRLVTRVLLLALILPSLSHGQIPAGWAVVASFRGPSSFNAPGVGGLWAVHPTTPGAAVPITGVPAWVSGCQWPTAQYAGADFVLLLPDGRLLTNGSPWPLPTTPTSMLVSALTLSGSAVVAVETWDFGNITAASSLGIPQAALLPDGRVVLAVDRIGDPGQALADQTLALLDPSIPAGTAGVTNPAPIPLGGWIMPPNQAVNALCVDPSGTFAYFGTTDLTNGSPSYLYRASTAALPPGSPPTLIATLPTLGIRTLAFEASSGALIAGGGGPNKLSRVNPTTGVLTPIAFSSAPNAVVIEPSTGAFLIATSYPAAERVWRLAPGAATPTILCSGPATGYVGCPGFAAGWASVGGIDAAPAHRRLGPGAPGPLSNYDWDLAPAPNALPYSGNPSFGLTLRSTSGAIAGWLGIATATLPSPLLLGPGIPIYLDPAALVLLDLPAALTLPIGPFAIPLGLAGATVSFQSLHLDGAVSSGLAVTIL